MDDIRYVRPLVKREVLNGGSRRRIFKRCLLALAPQYQHQELSVRPWFECLDAGQELGDVQECLPQFHLLLRTIQHYYKRAKKGLELVKCQAELGCKLEMISERHAIDVKMHKKFYSLVMIDLFLGQKREIDVQNAHLLGSLDILHKVKTIDPEHLILIFKNRENDIFTMHLLKIDRKTMNATLTDSKSLIQHFHSIHFDRNNRHRFVILLGADFSIRSRSNSTFNYWLGLIRNCNFKMQYKIMQFRTPLRDGGQLGRALVQQGDNPAMIPTVVARIMAQRTANPDEVEREIPKHYIKFEDSKLHGFDMPEDGGNERTLFYISAEIGTEPARSSEVKVIENDLDVQSFLGFNPYAWHKNTCYTLHFVEENKNCLFKIDTETRRLTPISISTNSLNFHFSGLFFDAKLEVLSVCIRGSSLNRHALERVPLNRPDSLCNIALLAISREVLFLDKNEQKALLKKVPPTVTSFVFN